MNFRKQNIVRKQVIDFTINAPVDGFKFQTELEVLCRKELARALENLCEKYTLVDEVISLDSLFAEVEFSSIDELKSSFAGKIVAELEKNLGHKTTQQAKSPELTSISVANSIVKTLVFYLKEGFLPWWSSVKTSQDWQDFVNVVCSEEVERTDWVAIYAVLRQQPARKRMLEIFTKKQIWILIRNSVAVTPAQRIERDLKTLLAAIQIPEEQQKFSEWCLDILWLTIARANGEPIFIEQFSELLVQEIKQNHIMLFRAIHPERIDTVELKYLFVRELEREKGKNMSPETTQIPETLNNHFKSSELTESGSLAKKVLAAEKNAIEAIYIGNSGLVIVAAFLPMFFKDVALIKNDVLDVDKAIGVLQYIVKGQDAYEEFESVLPKILCGLEISQPIARRKLSKIEKAKINDLLESVIEHWEMLKNTSIDGLRASFLQREGRLTFQDNEWKLKVKQEAYDMLLSHLPWNISIIKLPWMKCLLNVEWT